MSSPAVPAGASRTYGSTHEDMRRHNLSTILKMVHRAGPTSRSELARVTSLNKSTIGALSKELLELGLVEELIPNRNAQAGRPSRVVAPNARVVVIAVHREIGAVTIGLVSLGGHVIRRARYTVPLTRSLSQVVGLCAAYIDGMRAELDRDFDVVGIGVAVTGMVHAPNGTINQAPHLEWANEPIVEMLREVTGYAVFADNDARLGSLAERHFGVGRGVDDMIYLSGGSSGIGGGIIAGGRALSGFSGYAGAFGHVRTNDGTSLDTAGIGGTFEAEVSRAALLAAVDLPDADPDTLESALLASSDPAVRDLVHRQLEHLAIVLADAVNILNPKLIVLGGFLASIFAVDSEYLEHALAAKALPGAYVGVEIRSSGLGFDMMLMGAAELVFEGLLDDPARPRVDARDAEVESVLDDSQTAAR